jgi:hypothetical protein
MNLNPRSSAVGIAAAVALAGSAGAAVHELPDPHLTPGAINSTVTQATIHE